MEKQTAVEWLVEQINKYWDNEDVNSDELIKQAKEIEKDQIMNAWAEGIFSQGYMTAEKYYNETFKK